MGECCGGGVSVPQPQREDVVRPSLLHDGAVTDRRLLKHVFDNVHGNITLDPLSLKFIDTEQFQRLRDLKQLGLTCMVYPGAVHTRFEHSLGVYWLAGEAVRCLQTYQGSEIGIDYYDFETVKLAGLLHDIGHGPFSHLFEHEFLPQVLPGFEWSHEQMSVQLVEYMVDENHIDIQDDCLRQVKVRSRSHEQMSVQLVEYMVDENHIDIQDDCLRQVKEMIIASSKFAAEKSRKEKQFLYDIVANGRNGIDVDKFDYISRDCRACGLGCNFQFPRLLEGMRVMEDEICYPAKEYLTIHKLFSTRADLHRTVYTHAKVKAIELMVVDALVKANDYLKISSYPFDPAQYWKLDDTILKTIEFADSKKLKESREIIRRIRQRDLYQFCNEYAVPKDRLEYFKDITPQDIICSQKANGVELKIEDIAVSNVKIDLTRGKHNPLESISFFKDYDSEKKFSITDDRISHLLPACYQDRIVRVYAKKPELVEAVSEAFENLQLKIYGVKFQVHDTPEKKRRRI